MRKVPVVLVGKDYWSGLTDWIENTVLGEEKNISKDDLDLYKLVDTPEEAMEYLLERLDGNGTNF